MKRSSAGYARIGLSVGLLLAACSGVARVPPGLPPPEYERPAPSPWPPASAGGAKGADSASPSAPAPAALPPESAVAGAPGE